MFNIEFYHLSSENRAQFDTYYRFYAQFPSASRPPIEEIPGIPLPAFLYNLLDLALTDLDSTYAVGINFQPAELPVHVNPTTWAITTLPTLPVNTASINPTKQDPAPIHPILPDNAAPIHPNVPAIPLDLRTRNKDTPIIPYSGFPVASQNRHYSGQAPVPVPGQVRRTPNCTKRQQDHMENIFKGTTHPDPASCEDIANQLDLKKEIVQVSALLVNLMESL